MENRREKTNARRLTRLAGYLLFAAVCKTAGSFLRFGWETAVSAAGFLLPAAAELHRGRRFFF
ncbi:MAG: hypothetical protein MJ078_02750, partial [Clostridia bacterium]|nr:hypothetical protein [Clostridia bacterium]